MLKETERAQGKRTDLVPKGNQVEPTLKELGLTKKESSSAQKLADLPKEIYEEVHHSRIGSKCKPIVAFSNEI